jgi:NSS family neurotransmitter:Na+ symporter
VNQYGILVVALVSMLVVVWAVPGPDRARDHLNVHGRPPVGTGWRVPDERRRPGGLAVVLVLALRDDLERRTRTTPPGSCCLRLAAGRALPLIAFLLARLPWRAGTHLDGPPPGSDPAAPLHATAQPEPATSRRPVTGHDQGDRR